MAEAPHASEWDQLVRLRLTVWENLGLLLAEEAVSVRFWRTSVRGPFDLRLRGAAPEERSAEVGPSKLRLRRRKRCVAPVWRGKRSQESRRSGARSAEANRSDSGSKCRGVMRDEERNGSDSPEILSAADWAPGGKKAAMRPRSRFRGEASKGHGNFDLASVGGTAEDGGVATRTRGGNGNYGDIDGQAADNSRSLQLKAKSKGKAGEEEASETSHGRRRMARREVISPR